MSELADIAVVYVKMPERGVFLVRADCAEMSIPAAGITGRWVTEMDYGEDVGTVCGVASYDPERHGDRIPGFRLIRPFDAVTDERRQVENDKLAAAMRTTFVRSASASVPDIGVPYARLSFGRNRLFMRFTSAQLRADVTKALTELKRIFGIDAQAWQMGPRDEVAAIGGMGVCGRACCCASWQLKFPQRLNPDRRENIPMLMNGICGRFKCCLAFERP